MYLFVYMYIHSNFNSAVVLFVPLGFWVLDFGLWVLDFGFGVLDFGFWILGFGFWVWILGSWGLRPLEGPEGPWRFLRLEGLGPEAPEGALEASRGS